MSDSATLWAAACQDPLAVGFSRQEYWRGLSCAPSGNLPHPRDRTHLSWSSALAGGLFPGGSAGKESACNAGDMGLVPGLGRSPGEGKGYPLQYSGLENSVDCIVHGVTKSWTRLSDFHFFFTTSATWEALST